MNLRTVLLVDDEQAILDTYRTVLGGDDRDADLDELASIVGMEADEEEEQEEERERFRLIEAHQGEEALELQRQAIAAGSPPYVALVDMRMPPGINGLETAIRLRQQDSAIHIIIITAYSDVESRTIQLALQHDFIFLKKPVVADELHQIVSNAANSYQSTMRNAIKRELAPPLYLDHATRQQVLVVDDEPMMLKLAEAILLQYLQVKVITASTGQEALQLAHTLNPDLILLDVRMSGMDGFTVCRALKATEDTRDIPVMFVTAQSGDEHVIEGFNAGAVDYISKPFSRHILVARVSTHLNLYRNSRRLKMLSNTDMLTDLPNRAAFQTYLEMRLRDVQSGGNSYRRREDELQEEGGGFALLFIDLDHFKPVNDELGHEVGDQLLQAVAERLRKNVREVDLLARIGGDEFVLMLGGKQNQEQVALIADKMVSLLCQPFHIDRHVVQIGASIGSARYPDDATTGEELLRNADIAMYEAKAEGRSCHVTFAKEFEEIHSQREQLAAELRVAIEEDQLELLFQPRVDLIHREVIGFDALLRWNHPQRGVLSADHFIDVLMEGRLGEMAEHWSLKSACSHILQWHARLERLLPINLNLAEDRFNQHDLDQYIGQIALDTGLASELLHYLVLDISESVVMKHPDTAVVQLQRLRETGIQVMLDNFGSGCSSIRHLEQMPLAAVKLDRTLVEVDAEKGMEQTMRATLALVHALGHTAIAEGLESQDQIDRLQRLGCNAGAGYYLGGPLTAAEVETSLQQNSPSI